MITKMKCYEITRDVEPKYVKHDEGNLFTLITQRVVIYLSLFDHNESLIWRTRYAEEEPHDDLAFARWYEMFMHVTTCSEWNKQIGWSDFTELNRWMLK